MRLGRLHVDHWSGIKRTWGFVPPEKHAETWAFWLDLGRFTVAWDRS